MRTRVGVVAFLLLCTSIGYSSAQQHTSQHFLKGASAKVTARSRLDGLAKGRTLQAVPFTASITSQFWGGSGQAFSYTGRFSDWSWAGYRMGEQAIPSPDVSYDVVKDFGAVPDDDQSDWDAFNTAVNSIPKDSVLYIPAGQYMLERPLTITKSIIIRGAGRDVTTLYFPYSFNDWQPSTSHPSPWTSGPFFISFQGRTPIDSSTRLGWVKAYAQRGSTTFRVTMAKGAELFNGQTLRFIASDKDGNLVTYLYGNLTEKDWPDHLSSTAIINRKNMLQFTSRIKSFHRAADSEVIVELERPLPFDLQPGKWRDLAIYNDWRMSEAGIEDLTIEFAFSIYNGHLREAGYNALAFYGCQHSWARRLRITNVDVGLHVAASAYFTVEDIIFSETSNREGGIKNRWDGHHGLRSDGGGCMMPMQFETNNIHDMTFDHTSVLNVWYDITGPNLSLDFHSTCSAANLISRVNCGRCKRVWIAGGDVKAGGHAGMMNVFWGMAGKNATTTFPPMGRGWGARTTVVGAPFSRTPNYNDIYYEPVNPANLLPWDLHTAMVSWRQLGLNTEAIDAAQQQLLSGGPKDAVSESTPGEASQAPGELPLPSNSSASSASSSASG